ncbi:uncharacterized protein [Ambystoma mexicanum]|uniref:uncharacterized protein n=1 Tax=Ambystoma mexicanum TaxID=8296 RepID=UPI0037E7EB09
MTGRCLEGRPATDLGGRNSNYTITDRHSEPQSPKIFQGPPHASTSLQDWKPTDSTHTTITEQGWESKATSTSPIPGQSGQPSTSHHTPITDQSWRSRTPPHSPIPDSSQESRTSPQTRPKDQCWPPSHSLQISITHQDQGSRLSPKSPIPDPRWGLKTSCMPDPRWGLRTSSQTPILNQSSGPRPSEAFLHDQGWGQNISPQGPVTGEYWAPRTSLQAPIPGQYWGIRTSPQASVPDQHWGPRTSPQAPIPGQYWGIRTSPQASVPDQRWGPRTTPQTPIPGQCWRIRTSPQASVPDQHWGPHTSPQAPIPGQYWGIRTSPQASVPDQHWGSHTSPQAPIPGQYRRIRTSPQAPILDEYGGARTSTQADISDQHWEPRFSAHVPIMDEERLPKPPPFPLDTDLGWQHRRSPKHIGQGCGPRSPTQTSITNRDPKTSLYRTLADQRWDNHHSVDYQEWQPGLPPATESWATDRGPVSSNAGTDLRWKLESPPSNQWGGRWEDPGTAPLYPQSFSSPGEGEHLETNFPSHVYGRAQSWELRPPSYAAWKPGPPPHDPWAHADWERVSPNHTPGHGQVQWKQPPMVSRNWGFATDLSAPVAAEDPKYTARSCDRSGPIGSGCLQAPYVPQDRTLYEYYKPLVHFVRKEQESHPAIYDGNSVANGGRNMRYQEEEKSSGYIRVDNKSPNLRSPHLDHSFSEEDRSLFPNTTGSIFEGETAINPYYQNMVLFKTSHCSPTAGQRCIPENEEPKRLGKIIDRSSTFNNNAAEKLEIFLTQKVQAMNACPSNMNSYSFNIPHGDHGAGASQCQGLALRVQDPQSAFTLQRPDRSQSLEMIRQVMDHTNRIQLMQSRFESSIQSSNQQRENEGARDSLTKHEMTCNGKGSQKPPCSQEDQNSPCINSNLLQDCSSKRSCASQGNKEICGRKESESPLNCVLSKSVFPPEVTALNSLANLTLSNPFSQEEAQLSIDKRLGQQRDCSNASSSNLNKGNSNSTKIEKASKQQEKCEDPGCRLAPPYKEQLSAHSHIQRWIGEGPSDAVLGSNAEQWLSSTLGGVSVIYSGSRTRDEEDQFKLRHRHDHEDFRWHRELADRRTGNPEQVSKDHQPTQSDTIRRAMEEEETVNNPADPQSLFQNFCSNGDDRCETSEQEGATAHRRKDENHLRQEGTDNMCAYSPCSNVDPWSKGSRKPDHVRLIANIFEQRAKWQEELCVKERRLQTTRAQESDTHQAPTEQDTRGKRGASRHSNNATSPHQQQQRLPSRVEDGAWWHREREPQEHRAGRVGNGNPYFSESAVSQWQR